MHLALQGGLVPNKISFWFQQQQQQQKSAAATAAAARARGNEINSARRLLKIGFAPADLLYSESLTQKYSKVGTNFGLLASSCTSGTEYATRSKTEDSFELNFETKQLARPPRSF